MSDEPQPGGPIPDVEIHTPSPEKAQEWITALAAAGIPCGLDRVGRRWVILVTGPDSERARNEIAAYEAVNVGWPPKPRTFRRPALFQTWAGFWGVHLLLLFSIWIGPYNEHAALRRAGAADAGAILAGEWWRAVTALTLHSGVVHLAGNILFLLLLGQAVCRRFGPGLGWLLILASGTLGNLLSARLGLPGHVSVGASTAAFGSVGILALAQAVENFRRFGEWRSIWSRTWIPLGAGLGLLGLTGVGERSDLVAHGMGFACGLLVALPLTLARLPPLGRWGQRLLAALCVLAVAAAWLLASRSAGWVWPSARAA